VAHPGRRRHRSRLPHHRVHQQGTHQTYAHIFRHGYERIAVFKNCQTYLQLKGTAAQDIRASDPYKITKNTKG
jgi:hypothetical protein